MVVDDHIERAVQILMIGDPLKKQEAQDFGSSCLVELVKQHADDDKILAHLQKSHEREEMDGL